MRDPFIVSWPAGLADHAGATDQYCHAVDVLPTILDLSRGRGARGGGRHCLSSLADYSVLEAALSAGFESPEAFSRAFGRAFD